MENKYESIVEFINEQMKIEKLKHGNKLPSIREISEKFNCSKSTAIRAYSELEKNHIIYSVPKSGYYVIENRRIENSKNSSEDINFRSAETDSEIVPYSEVQHCLDQAIDIYKDSLFSYSDPRGIPSLRNVLAKHFQDYQIFTSPENIFIVSGSQQAINLLCRMPFPNGKTNVLVDQPTYPGILNSLRINNITAIGIERGFKGIDFNEIERIFSNGNIKFYYTMPRFHNPTGNSFTNEEKKKLLHLAHKYDVYIVEDDYLADIEIDSKSDPVFSYDTTSRVIYVKSYSKVLLPGLRLGAVVLPKLLINNFVNFKKCDDLSTSILSQGVLEICIKSGMYTNHVKRIKPYYSDKMNTFSQIVRNFKDKAIKYNAPKTGIYACFEISGSVDTENLIHNLKTRNVFIPDIRKCYLPSFEREDILRVNICRMDKDKMQKGISIIFEEINSLLNDSYSKAQSFSEL